jgi:hypothetical protein
MVVLLFSGPCPCLLALGAQAIKVQLVMGDPIAGLPGHFLGDLSHGLNLGIKDPAAPGANDMGVGERLIAVIPAPQVGQIKFQDLVHLSQQVNGFINSCQTGSGKIGFDLFIDLLDTGVSGAPGEDF